MRCTFLTRKWPHRGGDDSLAKELAVAPTQFSAADTVRVVRGAVDQSDLDAAEAPAAPDVRYRRLDGWELNPLCCNLFRVNDGLVQDYRIDTDVNPVKAVGGGPLGAGEAVGRSMVLRLVSVQVVVLAAALARYGVNPNFAVTV
jgi:hypothetical protein